MLCAPSPISRSPPWLNRVVIECVAANDDKRNMKAGEQIICEPISAAEQGRQAVFHRVSRKQRMDGPETQPKQPIDDMVDCSNFFPDRSAMYGELVPLIFSSSEATYVQ